MRGQPRPKPVCVPTEKTAYVGMNEEGEWMLFRTWEDANESLTFHYFVPARPSEVYFAELCNRVIPAKKEQFKFRRR